jgi:Pyruvate/2-oxoacid:ferredoxin oxidoreductase delta subunit
MSEQGVGLTQPRRGHNVAGVPRLASLQIAVVDSNQCDECGLCIPLCPPNAIALRRAGLHIDAQVCTGCQKCIAPCPVFALTMVDRPRAEATG